MNWDKQLFYHAVFLLLVIWPAIVICRRAGIKPAWVAVLGVPLFGVVLFACVMGFKAWSINTLSGVRDE